MGYEPRQKRSTAGNTLYSIGDSEVSKGHLPQASFVSVDRCVATQSFTAHSLKRSLAYCDTESKIRKLQVIQFIRSGKKASNKLPRRRAVEGTLTKDKPKKKSDEIF